MPYYMYVSLQDDDKIATFTMDADTGKLTHKGDTAVPDGPGSLAISPDRQVLYASHRNGVEISSYRIDQNTGGLTQNGKVTVGPHPPLLPRTSEASSFCPPTTRGRTRRCILWGMMGQWAGIPSNGVRRASAPIRCRPTPPTG